MNSEFCIPSNPESLEADYIQDVVDVADLNDDEICMMLDNIDSELNSPGPLTIAKRSSNDQTFDQLYSLASKHFLALCESNRAKLLEILMSGFANLLKVIPALEVNPQSSDEALQMLFLQRNALKMFTWLLHRIVMVKERTKEADSDRVVITKKGGRKRKKERTEGFESFEGLREKMLRLFIHGLEFNHLWDMGHPEEAYLRILTQTSLVLIENPENVSAVAVKEGIVSLLALIIQQHLAGAHHTAPVGHGPSFNSSQRRESVGSVSGSQEMDEDDGPQGSRGDGRQADQGGPAQGLDVIMDLVVNPLVEALIKYEHVGKAVTDLLLKTHADPAQRGFVPLFMQHVFLQTTTQFDASDSVGARNIAQLLTDVAEQRPALVHENISSIHGNLDCESYAIRNGVVHAIGQVVIQLLSSDKAPAIVKSRNKFLDILLERLRDVNSFCRSKVLGVWKDLWQKHCVPLIIQPTVITATMGRLKDKTCLVRRAALQLLTSVLEYNPYGQALVLTSFEEKMKAVLNELQSSDVPETAMNSEASETGEPELDAPPTESNPHMRVKYRAQFFKSGCTFIQQMHNALHLATQLLFSKTITDVTEAIHFVEAAYKFKLEPSQAAANKAAVLIFSIEPKVQETVQAAFQNMLSSWDTGAIDPAVLVHRLIKLVSTAQEGELASLEEIMSQLTQKGLVGPATVDALWSLIAGQGARMSENRTAMRIFAMVAQCKPEIVRKRLSWIEETGLPIQSKRDYLFGVYLCMALQKLTGMNAKFPPSHPIIRQLASLITRKTSDLSLWMPLAEAALNSIYALCAEPEVVSRALLHKLVDRYSTVQHLLKGPTVDDAGNSLCQANEVMLSTEEQHEVRAHLMRLLFMVGHSALKQLVFLEERYRQAIAAASDHKPDAVDADGNDGADSEDGIQQQLGMQSHAAADAEAERELRAQEQAMGAPTSIWCRHFPLIVQVCLNPHDDPLLRHPVLRSCASLSLCKLILLTISNCNPQYLQVLFTVLKAAPEWHIRCNMVICVGDLLCRFPNATTPWVPEFFKRFRDSHPAVRSTALNVARHLILNDMLKGTRHMHYLALALQDADPKIAEMARLFFRELDLKSKHHIYNAVPDIFSELTADPDVSEERLQRIFSFLLSFVDGTVHAESLIEKLCQRMPAPSRDPNVVSMAHSVAFCLAQLAVLNEKTLRRLDSCFGCYAKMLYDDTVFQHLMGVLLKFKRTAKDAQKTMVEELEARLVKQHEIGAEQQEMEVAMQQHIEERSKGRTKRGRVVGDPDNDDDDDDFCPAPKPVSQRAGNSTPGQRGQKAVVLDDASPVVKEEDPSEDEQENAAECTRVLRPRKQVPQKWGLRDDTKDAAGEDVESAQEKGESEDEDEDDDEEEEVEEGDEEEEEEDGGEEDGDEEEGENEETSAQDEDCGANEDDVDETNSCADMAIAGSSKARKTRKGTKRKVRIVNEDGDEDENDSPDADGNASVEHNGLHQGEGLKPAGDAEVSNTDLADADGHRKRRRRQSSEFSPGATARASNQKQPALHNITNTRRNSRGQKHTLEKSPSHATPSKRRRRGGAE